MCYELIVVFAAFHRCTAESNTVFHTQNRRQAEKCFGEVGFDFVEYRFTQSGQNVVRDYFRHATNGIARFS